MKRLHKLALLLTLLLLSPLTVQPLPPHRSPSTPLPPSSSPLLSPSSPSSLRLPGVVHNAFIDPAADCALRAFVVERATYLQPAAARTDWGLRAIDALQMAGQCPGWLPSPSPSTPAASASYPSLDVACGVEVFVSPSGSDANAGTLASPLATPTAALRLTRYLRSSTLTPACITLRAGTYHLGSADRGGGDQAADSRVGVLELTAIDSNLTLRAYPGEEGQGVILSGGVPLTPAWVPYVTLPAGVVYSTPLPPSLDLSPTRFNELYLLSPSSPSSPSPSTPLLTPRRATRAKWPNGDPATHGIHTSPSGYTSAYDGWLSPIPPPTPPTEIHIASPIRNGTAFPQYHLGVGGTASPFNPPHNFWSTSHPPQGAMYVTPAGVVWGEGAFPRARNWTRVEDALVFAIHGNDWASWVFGVGWVDVGNRTIGFSAGGWQEARGAPSGHQYYVANLLEELDEADEWYLDRAARRLYFMPNTSAAAPLTAGMVAAQVPCLISITGTVTRPVRAVTITGLTLSYTSSTFMRDYEAPPGGDVAVHRGGAVYLEGTEDVLLHANLLTQLGGNGVVLSDYNLRANISQNELAWLGDNGVVAIGSVEGMDGVSDRRQPTLTTMDGNLVREVGIYTKQVAPFFQAVTRASTVSRNVMFNVPRAAVNTNDGFHGNHTIAGNVLFNCVRETGDHGPINTSAASSPPSPLTLPRCAVRALAAQLSPSLPPCPCPLLLLRCAGGIGSRF